MRISFQPKSVFCILQLSQANRLSRLPRSSYPVGHNQIILKGWPPLIKVALVYHFWSIKRADEKLCLISLLTTECKHTCWGDKEGTPCQFFTNWRHYWKATFFYSLTQHLILRALLLDRFLCTFFIRLIFTDTCQFLIVFCNSCDQTRFISVNFKINFIFQDFSWTWFIGVRKCLDAVAHISELISSRSYWIRSIFVRFVRAANRIGTLVNLCFLIDELCA